MIRLYTTLLVLMYCGPAFAQTDNIGVAIVSPGSLHIPPIPPVVGDNLSIKVQVSATFPG